MRRWERERQSWSDCEGRRKESLFLALITLRAVQRDSRSNSAHSLTQSARILSEQSPSCPSLKHGLYNLRPGPSQELERVKVRPEPNMHAESAECLHLARAEDALFRSARLQHECCENCVRLRVPFRLEKVCVGLFFPLSSHIYCHVSDAWSVLLTPWATKPSPERTGNEESYRTGRVSSHLWCGMMVLMLRRCGAHRCEIYIEYFISAL